MSGPFHPKKGHDDSEAWLITYADAITLVTSFFLIMLSTAKFDVAKYEQMAEGMTKEIAGRTFESSVKALKLDVEDIVIDFRAEEAVQVGANERGVVMELASAAFYRPGSAEILDQAIPLLRKLAQSAASPRYQSYGIEVEGHTDDDPISTVQFPSNWELSSARATRVVRFFNQEGVNQARLKAVGYGESRPKVPNRDANGAPNKKNQAVNRRVVLRLYPMSDRELDAVQTLMETSNPKAVDIAKSGPKQP